MRAQRDFLPYAFVTFTVSSMVLGRYACGTRWKRVGAMHDDTYVRDISSLRISDAEEAGGKGANMGELVAAKLPVPPGFVLLRDCYRDSMRVGGVDADLAELHREATANVADTTHLSERCERLQRLVQKAGIAESVREPLLAAYRALGPDAVVAVRSSATGEDGADASFAGMNATITNVSGEESLIDAVLRCWMSLFSQAYHLPRQP